MQRHFGLIGETLKHSFSKNYFTKKFKKEGIPNCSYELYELPTIKAFPELLQSNPLFAGINVTIPYKEEVIPYLDELDEDAAAIGAVNCIMIKEGKLKGYNTDAFGFKYGLQPFIKKGISYKALVLGTGGASKAIHHVFQQMGIASMPVSRTKGTGKLSYDQIDEEVLQTYNIIVNTTPLGTYPNEHTYPDLPYSAINDKHLLYDLVYNPEKTLFLQQGAENGAAFQNGLPMLIQQAEQSWTIWNE